MRPLIAIMPLIALAACLEQDRIEALPDTDPIVTVDTDVEPDTDPNFRWDPIFGVIALDGALNGTDISLATTEGWITRTAGTGGSIGIGYGGSGMRGKRTESATTGRPAPMMEAEMDGEGGGMLMDAYSEDSLGGPASVLVPTGTAPLKAAITDDNADYDAFLLFLDTWKGRPGVAGNAEEIDVSDRQWLKVIDDAGNPLPGAKVTVLDRQTDELIWSGTTYGDGRAPYYPHLTTGGGSADNLLVQAHLDGDTAAVRWNGQGEEIAVTLSEVERSQTVKLDVVFLIDTTGSMADEIARIKRTLLSVTEQVNGLGTEIDLQYGAVLYRDIGDEYLTRHTPLTKDIQGFDAIIQGIAAGGGGDGPESLNQGLSVSVSEMDWRDGAAKMVFLVADAPPHMDYQSDATYGRAALTAMVRGIRIHTVAASGLDDFGSLVFRQSAQISRGQFIFIEYGSTSASAADHGVTGQVASNNLDAILFRQIRDEVEGWGRASS